VKQTKSDEDVTAEESEKAEQEISYYKSTSTTNVVLVHVFFN